MVCDDGRMTLLLDEEDMREVAATVWRQQIGFVNPCELEMELNTTGVSSVSHPNRANNHRREEYHTCDSQDGGQLLLKHQIRPFVLQLSLSVQFYFQSQFTGNCFFQL